MAVNQQKNNVQRNASLRRIAIVLSSLPSETAAKLLGTMPTDERNELRRAVATLSDVDPLERQRALGTFTKSIHRTHGDQTPAVETDSNEDEILISRVHLNQQNGSNPNHENQSEYTGGNPAFRFLASTADADLTAILKSELPQTIAIVLASISPSQAAAILPRFEKAMRMDTINRIGRLGEISEETEEAVVAHMQQRIERFAESQKHTSGRRALDAILAELPNSEATEDRHSNAQNVSNPRVVKTESHATTTQNSEVIDEVFQNAVASVHRSASQPRIKTMNPQKAKANRSEETPQLRIAPSTRIQVERPSIETMSTDAIHELLVGLEPAELCDALGKVPTETAILAICGLPPQVTDAALAELPRSAARDVRRQLSMVGAMELREIDEAKHKIAAQVIPPGPKAETGPHVAIDQAITSGGYASAAA